MKSNEDVMGNALKKLVEDNLNALTNISDAGSQVTVSSSQVASASQALAQGSTQQASAIQQITASIDEIAEKTKGNAEEALKNIETSKNGSKQKLSETDIKQIMWIIRNAVLPEDSSDLKDLKLSKIFESEMSKTETTQNPLTLSYIKEILTEDD